MSLFSTFLFSAFLCCVIISVMGIFKKEGSLLRIFASIPVVVLGGIGARYTWLETGSSTGTAVYSLVALVGLISMTINLVKLLNSKKKS